MRILLFLTATVLFPASLWANSTTNRSEIVKGYLEQIVCDVEDDFDDDAPRPVRWTYWTQEGFFGRMSPLASEQELYRQAFESVVLDFATNDWSSIARGDDVVPREEIARIALCQVRDFSYTNALPYVMKWARNRSAPHRDIAQELCYRWSELNDDLLAVAGCVLTNATSVSRSERIETCQGLMSALARHKRRFGQDRYYSNTVDLAYRARLNNVACAAGFDNLFVAEIEGYEFSSNRLETAIAWMNTADCGSEVRGYCATVTNRLINAVRPLVEVEMLRGQ